MRLIPSDPDVQTIVSRIKNGDLDLQPAFQRGEVWGTSKKRRLIDSILRNWHVPPIHVVENPETAKQEVLDGQQRLVAIRDFVAGEITVDGNAAPYSESIAKLNGLTYDSLPTQSKRRFDQFTIRLIRIIDFEPDEPAELFFRLNQPVGLTTAEQRNAFFGPIREQVKNLVERFGAIGSPQVKIGFSNSRMAIDDVLARVCLALEKGTLQERVTSTMLANCYRAKQPFLDTTYRHCTNAIDSFVSSSHDWPAPVKLNKATLFSWLWFAADISRDLPTKDAGDAITSSLRTIESFRAPIFARDTSSLKCGGVVLPPHAVRALLQVYGDRSSSRVADVISVVARDIVIWVFFGGSQIDSLPSRIQTKLSKLGVELDAFDDEYPEALVHDLMINHSWGDLQ